MLDWSLKERAHCRSFPVVLQAQLFEGTGDSSTDFADLEPMRTKELSVLPAVFLNYRCNRRNLWIYREEIRRRLDSQKRTVPLGPSLCHRREER